MPTYPNGIITLFVALQELRVPWTRQNLGNVYGQLVKRVNESRAAIPGLLERDLRTLEESGETLEGVTADSLREFLQRGEYTIEVNPAVSLRSMLELAPLLHGFYIEMQWTILRAPGTAQFITSDNPVIKFDPNYRGGFYGVGMYSDTIEIRFPVSRTACLFITQDHDRQNEWHKLMEAGKRSEAETLRRRVPTIRFLQASPRAVETINGLTIEYATRFVYSSVRDTRIPRIMQGEPRALRFQVS